MILDDLNSLILAIFAPILILVGILGFIIPLTKV
jgi:preprotein translocase subunit Sss1